ncbi:hypothetical protein Tco_1441827 [Tanacetum coccineum]
MAVTTATPLPSSPPQPTPPPPPSLSSSSPLHPHRNHHTDTTTSTISFTPPPSRHHCYHRCLVTPPPPAATHKGACGLSAAPQGCVWFGLFSAPRPRVYSGLVLITTDEGALVRQKNQGCSGFDVKCTKGALVYS